MERTVESIQLQKMGAQPIIKLSVQCKPYVNEPTQFSTTHYFANSSPLINPRCEWTLKTSKHSSMMCITRQLTVSGGGVCLGGLSGGGCLEGEGVCLPMALWEWRPPVKRETPMETLPSPYFVCGW